MEPRKIVQVENIELDEWKLLQLTLYSDEVVEVNLIADGKGMALDVPKRLFFYAALRLLQEDI